MSLPEAPLDRFKAKTAHLPRTTEAERWVIQRIGQDVFRAALLDYWDSRCPLTGITDPALLRASHIIPWSDCNDEQRLDVHNGLLLSALWDAAFDQGLVSFADDGTPLFGPKLSETARKTLGADAVSPLRGLRASHRANLAVHRSRHGFEN
jgi:predicted restriction endonuclease